jgi:hypothetical protein
VNIGLLILTWIQTFARLILSLFSEEVFTMRPVQGTRDFLQQTYPHLSLRSASRIVALSTFSLNFTALFLESCTPQSAEEQFLFDPALKQNFNRKETLEVPRRKICDP